MAQLERPSAILVREVEVPTGVDDLPVLQPPALSYEYVKALPLHVGPGGGGGVGAGATMHGATAAL